MRGAGAVVGAIVLGTIVARADEPPQIPIRVEATAGAESCPDAAALVAATNAAMKRTTLEAGDHGPVQIVVEFTREGDKYKAAIRVIGGPREGIRSIGDTSTKCDDLAEAVVVTLAVMLDEGVVAASASASAEPVSAPTVAPPPTPLDPHDVPPPPKPRAPQPKTFFELVGEVGIAFGVVAPTATYLGLDLDLARTHGARLAIGGLAVLPRSFAVAGGSAELSLLAGRILGCANLAARRSVDLDVCAAFAIGGIRGRTSGLSVDGDATRTWLALGAFLDGRGPLVSVLSWTLRLGALVPQTRHAFDVSGAGVVYEPEIAGVFLGAGLAATIF